MSRRGEEEEAAPSRAAAEADDPLLLRALARGDPGRLPSAKLRTTGRTPAVLYNQARCAHRPADRTHDERQFNEERELISLDSRELLRKARAVAAATSSSLTRRASPS